LDHQRLVLHPELLQHFQRSRGFFYSAESLARFSRDNFGGAFDKVKEHVADVVIDVAAGDHVDGFIRVLKTTEAAALIALPQSELFPYVSPSDKKGICHHLANDGRLRWARS
jgi:hypothetical protein